MAVEVIARDEDGRFSAYAWPGGYPVFHVCDDGAYLCPKCANAPQWRHGGHSDETAWRDGWLIIGSDINWEDPDLYCDHCGERIESAPMAPLG